MTTSKWDMLGEEDSKQENEEDLDGEPIEEENLDGEEMSENDYEDNRSETSYGTPRQQQSQEMSEERRRKLRDIEVKVMRYQYELEAGKRTRKPNMSISEQVVNHRQKLVAKEFSESPGRDSRKRQRTGSPSAKHEDKYKYDESPKRKRAKSPKSSRRSRYRSDIRRSRSRSTSRQRRKFKKSKHRD